MVRRLCIFFLLQLLYATTGALEKGDQGDLEYFSRRCPPERCSGSSTEIRYPFRLESSDPYCGSNGLVLSCSGGRAILPLPYLPPTLALSVVSIDYSIGVLTAKLDGPSCPLQYINLLNFSASSYSMRYPAEFITVNCSSRINFSDGSSSMNIAGPISCLGGGADSIYAVDSFSYMDEMPPYCSMISDSVSLPGSGFFFYNLTSLIDAFTQKMEINLEWTMRDVILQQCIDCESSGGRCVFSQARSQIVCFKTERHGSKAKFIIGSSVGGASVILVVSILIFYINKKKSDYEEEMRLKIENFLATYLNTKPTRYTYSEIKKITMRFKQKLGQGGFGAVYKGWIPNGIPVAVKMIEIANKDGDEFINEVATIGRIHHVNVVRLLGFCSDGSWRALVYEFMPNESLEKFIFSRGTNNSFDQHLVLENLEEIALGIAQGIEYLHQGCDLRILHFDIKPHNILLDHNFIPKISDFGLSKLCSRDQSMITMTAARGTMGYVAPEIFSRNFGSVSYKSDVYSFGMLLLEMVSGRKNVDPSIEDQSAVYFPEWVYDQLVRGQDLGLVVKGMGDEEQIAEKLIVVALWCIQWNPKDRPTMTRVVQMLLGELQDLEMPSRPFATSSVSEDAIIPMSSVQME